jgi:hypothetical protein
MALKFKISKLEEVEAQFHDLYEQDKDGYHLKVEGIDLDAPTKVKEFRTKNVDLMKENDELKKKYDGVDPDKFRELLNEKQNLEDKQKIDAGKIEELLAERTARMSKDFESQKTALEKALAKEKTERESLHKRLSEVLIDSEIRRAVSKVGSLKKGADELVLSIGKKVWSLEEGHPVARKDGQALYGKDTKPIEFDEWAAGLATEIPYVFEGAIGLESQGGGERNIQTGMTNKDFEKKSINEKLEIVTRQAMKK